MKVKVLIFLVLTVWFLGTVSTVASSSDFIGNAFKQALRQNPLDGAAKCQPKGAGLDEGTVASGPKDALSIGTKNAVTFEEGRVTISLTADYPAFFFGSFSGFSSFTVFESLLKTLL